MKQRIKHTSSDRAKRVIVTRLGSKSNPLYASVVARIIKERR